MYLVDQQKLAAQEVIEEPKKKGLGTKIKELFTGNPEEKERELLHEKEVIALEQ